MGRDGAPLEGRKFGGGTIDESLKLIGRTGATKSLAEAIGQQRSLWRPPIVLEPASQSPLGLRPQRYASVLASFSQELDLAPLDVHVHHSQRQDLRNAGARVVKEQEKEVVSLTSPTALRRGEDGFDFLGAHKTNQALDVPLEGDGGDPIRSH